jgi:hypothetical protein
VVPRSVGIKRGESERPRDEEEAAQLARTKSQGLFALAPHVLTLCGGAFSPFDFALGKHQHYQLYLSGQLSVHLAAAQLTPASRDTEGEYPWGGAVMSEENKRRALGYLFHLDYPN